MTNFLDGYIRNPQQPFSKSYKEIYGVAAEELLVPCPSTPIDFFPKLSRAIGGFRKREFTILCGATGIGKTTLIANWSKSWVAQKVPHFVASVETGPTDYVKRIVSAFEGKDWNTGDAVNLDEFKDFHARHASFITDDTLFLSLYDSRFSVETLLNDIAWHVKHKGIKIAMIDNLNFFLDVTSAANQLIEMDRVIHEVVIFCKRIDVHVVMIMHPKKTDGGRVESEFDIKGSSTAVQEAHNIFLFNRAGKDLVDAGNARETDRELKIAKMRRKGRIVGKRLVLRTIAGVTYEEGDLG